MCIRDRQRHSWRLHPSLVLEQVGAVEHYYEKQAAKGLLLESVGGWLDCFVHAEPCAMRYRAEPVLRGEQEGPDWDRQQFYKDAGWQYLGTAADLHFFASPADSGAEELHTDPQDFAPALRRQRRNSFWYSLIFSVVMLAVTDVYKRQPITRSPRAASRSGWAGSKFSTGKMRSTTHRPSWTAAAPN